MPRRAPPLNDNYQDTDDLSSVDNIDVSDSGSSNDDPDEINLSQSGGFSTPRNNESNSDYDSESSCESEIDGNGIVEEIEQPETEQLNEDVEQVVNEVEQVVEEVEQAVDETHVEQVVDEVEQAGEEIVKTPSTDNLGISDENDGFMNDIDNMLDSDTKMIQVGEPVKKTTKSTPNSSAKDFEVGHVEVSENSGEKYEVVANKNGVKRWKKVN
jgi:hypothetical protein